MALVGHEVHCECFGTLFGEEWGVDAAHVGSVVNEWIDAHGRVATDVLGGKEW